MRPSEPGGGDGGGGQGEAPALAGLRALRTHDDALLAYSRKHPHAFCALRDGHTDNSLYVGTEANACALAYRVEEVGGRPCLLASENGRGMDAAIHAASFDIGHRLGASKATYGLYGKLSALSRAGPQSMFIWSEHSPAAACLAKLPG